MESLSPIHSFIKVHQMVVLSTLINFFTVVATYRQGKSKMDLESKTDQWILGLTSAALSAAFGASAAYFHTVVNSGNWYYPRKPRNVSKDTLKNLLEESLEYVKQEAVSPPFMQQRTRLT